MVDRPDKSFFDQDQNSGAFRSGMYEPMLDFMGQLPGGDPEESLVLVTGVITPAKASVAVDTEGAAESDTLTNMGTDNLPVGSIVILRQADPNRQVTIQHNAAGGGAVLLDGGVDYAFPDNKTFIGVRLEASGDWQQVFPQRFRARDAFKNQIINGDFRLALRGVTFTPSINDYTLDRWSYAGTLDGGSLSGANVSRELFATGQGDVAGNPLYYMRAGGQITGAGGAEFLALSQPIEGVETLAGKTATISFDARASFGRELGVDLLQNFGTGGAPSSVRRLLGQNFTLGTDWARYSISITIPDLAGQTKGTDGNDRLEILLHLQAGASSGFTPTAGSAASVDVANVQVEEGLRPSEFEIRPLSIEQTLAERFAKQIGGFSTYPVAYGFANSGTVARMIIHAPVEMRANPGLTIQQGSFSVRGNGQNIAVTSITGGIAVSNGVLVSVDVASGLVSNDIYNLVPGSSGALLMDAEF